MISFDRSRLTERLAAMSRPRRVLFAAAISQRLFPHATHFFRDRDPRAVDALRDALELLWRYGADGREDVEVRDTALSACETLIRAAADEGTHAALFAENAAAAVA